MKEALIRNIHIPFSGPDAQYMRLIHSSVNFLCLSIVCALKQQTFSSALCASQTSVLKYTLCKICWVVGSVWLQFQQFNYLKTKHNLLYIRTHSVQHSKHFPPRLFKERT